MENIGLHDCLWQFEKTTLEFSPFKIASKAERKYSNCIGNGHYKKKKFSQWRVFLFRVKE